MDFITYPKNSSPKLKPPQLDSSFSKSNSQKLLQISSSLGAFKSSLNKNPSYFSIGRSPDILNENKKLKEENWRLRQQVTSLTEEVSKLKTRISHKYDPGKILMTEGVQIINQNKYIEVLQDSLRNLRNELSKSKKEIIELRKKVNSNAESVLDMQNLIQNRKKMKVMKYEPGQVKGQDQGLKEFNKTITYLKSEIKILQEEKNNVENELAEFKGLDFYKQDRQNREKRRKKGFVQLQIDRTETLFVGEKKGFTDSLDRTSQSLDVPDKVLKRENVKRIEIQVSKFFKHLFNELALAKVSKDELVNHLSKLDSNQLDLNFSSILEELGVKMFPQDIKDIFSILKQKNNQENSNFLSILQNYIHEIDSNRSSDISSRVSSAGAEVRISKVSMISTVFDNIALHVRDLNISIDHFQKFTEEHLPEHVNFRDLNDFFNKKVEFIQDPNDTTIIVVNFLEGYEFKPRSEIIQRSIEEFFKFLNDFKVNLKVIQNITERFKLKENALIEKMQAIDYYHLDTMTWETISQLLLVEECLFEEELHDFKLFCYLFVKNLKQIPYKGLLEHLESSKSNKLPEIKAFAKSKKLNS